MSGSVLAEAVERRVSAGVLWSRRPPFPELLPGAYAGLLRMASRVPAVHAVLPAVLPAVCQESPGWQALPGKSWRPVPAGAWPKSPRADQRAVLSLRPRCFMLCATKPNTAQKRGSCLARRAVPRPVQLPVSRSMGRLQAGHRQVRPARRRAVPARAARDQAGRARTTSRSSARAANSCRCPSAGLMTRRV
jgi:hypothetical protein